MNYILLVIGFILLVKGADYFVDGSSSIAKKLRIPSLIIGLTIVAFGTSAPEAAVSITALSLIHIFTTNLWLLTFLLIFLKYIRDYIYIHHKSLQL